MKIVKYFFGLLTLRGSKVYRMTARCDRITELWNFPTVEISNLDNFSNTMIDAQWRLRDLEQNQ
jgi:hypothetical protein